MRRYLDQLVRKGWLNQRRNPVYKWDKTFQYRVNVQKIQSDLQKMGYALEGYPLHIEQKIEKHVPSPHHNQSNPSTDLNFLPSNFHNETSNFQEECSAVQSHDSNFQHETPSFQNDRAIPEIITKNTPKITSDMNLEHHRVFQFYKLHQFGQLTPYITENILRWVQETSEEIVIKAMETALRNGKGNWNYVQAVLRDWKQKELKTVEQVAIYLDQRWNSSNIKPVRREIVPKWLHEDNEEPELDKAVYEEKRRFEERRKAYKEKMKELKKKQQSSL